MAEIRLRQAKQLITKTLAHGKSMGLKPLSVVVLDPGGNVKAFEREDGASNLRFNIAQGKAYSALGWGASSRAIMERGAQQPLFVAALAQNFDGKLIPSPGGLLIKDVRGNLLGAIGVTGDTGDNDEKAALAAIEEMKLIAA